MVGKPLAAPRVKKKKRVPRNTLESGAAKRNTAPSRRGPSKSNADWTQMAVDDAKQCYRAAFSPFDEHIMKELESVPRNSRDDARQRKLASLEAGNVELTRRV